MSISSLAITFASPGTSRRSVDALLLEQDKWKPYTGYVTKAAVARYLANIFWPEDSFDPRFDCGISGGQMILPIYCYPYSPGLTYNLKTSYGTLSERAQDLVEFSEVINFGLKKEASTKYPLRNLLKSEWVGDVFDTQGNVTALPAVSFQQSSITTATPVYGALRVTYSVERHTYILTVDARKEEVENLFSAVVYALYAGGIKWLEIEPPPGADEYLEGAEDCRWMWTSTGSATYPDDRKSRPKAAYADRIIIKDYCSGETISDETYGRVEMGDE